MKKLIQINTVCNTSTGKIMGAIQRKANEAGYRTISLVGRRKVFKDVACEKFGNFLSFWIHVAITTLFDRQGFGSYFVTRRLVRRLRQENADIIHLHNLHGYYLNLPVLFDYLAHEFSGQVFWTFHDCWPITGHCPHFAAKKCFKWRAECGHCPSKREYPISLVLDASTRNYRDKKRLFGSLQRLVITTPSDWMADWVKESFLSKYPVITIHNGIDLNMFSYHQPDQDFYIKYGMDATKKILLGVAGIWETRKGLKDFLELADALPDEYQIVLVGVSARQIRSLPRNIIGIQRTENVGELVLFYSAASIFINPSLEESFSLVTVEAIACGTPVVVLDTSAVKELVCEQNGIVLGRHNAEDYLQAIRAIEMRQVSREDVSKTAQKYDTNVMSERFMQLYQKKDGMH